MFEESPPYSNLNKKGITPLWIPSNSMCTKLALTVPPISCSSSSLDRARRVSFGKITCPSAPCAHSAAVSPSAVRPCQRHGHELPACYAPTSYPPCMATLALCSTSRSVDRRAVRPGGSVLVRLALLIRLSLSSLSHRCFASPPGEACPWRPSGHGSLLVSRLHSARDRCMHLHLVVRRQLASSSCSHRAGSHASVSLSCPTPPSSALSSAVVAR
jgi:hypothetical protein